MKGENNRIKEELHRETYEEIYKAAHSAIERNDLIERAKKEFENLTRSEDIEQDIRNIDEEIVSMENEYNLAISERNIKDIKTLENHKKPEEKKDHPLLLEIEKTKISKDEVAKILSQKISDLKEIGDLNLLKIDLNNKQNSFAQSDQELLSSGKVFKSMLSLSKDIIENKREFLARILEKNKLEIGSAITGYLILIGLVKIQETSMRLKIDIFKYTTLEDFLVSGLNMSIVMVSILSIFLYMQVHRANYKRAKKRLKDIEDFLSPVLKEKKTVSIKDLKEYSKTFKIIDGLSLYGRKSAILCMPLLFVLIYEQIQKDDINHLTKSLENSFFSSSIIPDKNPIEIFSHESDYIQIIVSANNVEQMCPYKLLFSLSDYLFVEPIGIKKVEVIKKSSIIGISKISKDEINAGKYQPVCRTLMLLADNDKATELEKLLIFILAENYNKEKQAPTLKSPHPTILDDILMKEEMEIKEAKLTKESIEKRLKEINNRVQVYMNKYNKNTQRNGEAMDSYNKRLTNYNEKLKDLNGHLSMIDERDHEFRLRVDSTIQELCKEEGFFSSLKAKVFGKYKVCEALTGELKSSAEE